MVFLASGTDVRAVVLGKPLLHRDGMIRHKDTAWAGVRGWIGRGTALEQAMQVNEEQIRRAPSRPASCVFAKLSVEHRL
jgi:hypothetical protein